MAVYTTVTAIGQAEDVQDIIYDISPTDKPFVSAIKKGTATAVLHQWQTDELRAAAKNAKASGAAAPAASAVPTVLLSNSTQIMTATASVSGTLDKVKKYGRRTEMAYQVQKETKSIGRDLEFAMVGTGRQTEVTGATREMACAQAQIDAATTISSTSGLNGGLIEADVFSVAELLYDEGSGADMLLIHQSRALDVAAFAAGTSKNRDFGINKTYVNAIDMIVTPYGDYTVALDRLLDPVSALMIDPDYWQNAVLRPTFQKPLGPVGDSTDLEIIHESTLACLNPKASGMIDTIDT